MTDTAETVYPVASENTFPVTSNSCAFYKAATYVVLAVLVLFLPFVLFVLRKWCKMIKQRFRRRTLFQPNGVVSIGRTRGTKYHNKKVKGFNLFCMFSVLIF